MGIISKGFLWGRVEGMGCFNGVGWEEWDGMFVTAWDSGGKGNSHDQNSEETI